MWKPPTQSTMSRPRSRTRRVSLLTSSHRQDDHTRCGSLRHNRQCQGQDP